MTDQPDEHGPAGWRPFEDKGFMDLVGPILVRDAPGRPPAFAFEAAAKHVNLLGLVHGGMLMTFADSALGIAAWEAVGRRPCVTVQFDMQFLSGAKTGEFVELEPEIVRSSRSLVFVRGMLRAGGRAAASVSGIWKILDE